MAMRQEDNDPSQKDRQSSLAHVDRILEELLPVTLVRVGEDGLTGTREAIEGEHVF